MRSIRTAFSFLTRLPTGGHGDPGPAVVWFPLVGLTVGAIVGLVHIALSELTEPLVAAAVAVSVGVLVTGGFHEDGLGDMADGFGGGWTVDRRLEIMRDSRLGTYGVLAITSTLVIRVAALSTLGGRRAVVLVACAHLLSRNWSILVLGFAEHVRPAGLSDASATGARRSTLAPAAVLWFVIAAVGLGPGRFAVMAGLGLVATGATVALSYRKIGGVTGDVLGAVEQVSETIGLVAAGLSRTAR